MDPGEVVEVALPRNKRRYSPSPPSPPLPDKLPKVLVVSASLLFKLAEYGKYYARFHHHPEPLPRKDLPNYLPKVRNYEEALRKVALHSNMELPARLRRDPEADRLPTDREFMEHNPGLKEIMESVGHDLVRQSPYGGGGKSIHAMLEHAAQTVVEQYLAAKPQAYRDKVCVPGQGGLRWAGQDEEDSPLVRMCKYDQSCLVRAVKNQLVCFRGEHCEQECIAHLGLTALQEDLGPMTVLKTAIAEVKLQGRIDGRCAADPPLNPPPQKIYKGRVDNKEKELKGYTLMCEVKSCMKIRDIARNGVPRNYMLQCQCYMYMANEDRMNLVLWYGNKKAEVVQVHWNQQVWDNEIIPALDRAAQYLLA